MVKRQMPVFAALAAAINLVIPSILEYSERNSGVDREKKKGTRSFSFEMQLQTRVVYHQHGRPLSVASCYCRCEQILGHGRVPVCVFAPRFSQEVGILYGLAMWILHGM